ncbi:hypothetical protein ACE6H2_024195 [Prunus campanulata]
MFVLASERCLLFFNKMDWYYCRLQRTKCVRFLLQFNKSRLVGLGGWLNLTVFVF